MKSISNKNKIKIIDITLVLEFSIDTVASINRTFKTKS